MQESVLTTIKKLLGLDEDYTHFDTDIILHINTVLMAAGQLGIEIAQHVTSSDETWLSILKKPRDDLEALKTYIYLKVRLLFDPPTNSFTIGALEKLAQEYEWRLNVQAEGGDNNAE